MQITFGLLLGGIAIYVGWQGPQLQRDLITALPEGWIDEPSTDPLAYARYWQFAALAYSAVYMPLGSFLREDRRLLGVLMYVLLLPVFVLNFYLATRSGVPVSVTALLSLIPIAVFAARDFWLGWLAPYGFRYFNPEQHSAKSDFVIVDIPALLSSAVLAIYIVTHVGLRGLDLFYVGAVAFELFVVNALFISRSLDRARRKDGRFRNEGY